MALHSSSNSCLGIGNDDALTSLKSGLRSNRFIFLLLPIRGSSLRQALKCSQYEFVFCWSTLRFNVQVSTGKCGLKIVNKLRMEIKGACRVIPPRFAQKQVNINNSNVQQNVYTIAEVHNNYFCTNCGLQTAHYSNQIRIPITKPTTVWDHKDRYVITAS